MRRRFPMRVMKPRFLVPPLECSDGTRPMNAINCGAVEKRDMSPISAAKMTAESILIPRID